MFRGPNLPLQNRGGASIVAISSNLTSHVLQLKPLGKENVLREDQKTQPKGPGSFAVPFCPRFHFLEVCSFLLLGESRKLFTESGSLPRTHCIKQPRTFTSIPGLVEPFHHGKHGGIIWSSRMGSCNCSVERTWNS